MDKASPQTTIFHVTHYKAGSQWIYSIMGKCAGERIVRPKLWADHFRKDPIVPGAIYPTVYVTKRVFDRVRKPENSRHFVVLRDLRDTSVSAYFSLKFSHAAIGDVEKIRKTLDSRDFEEGMLWIFRHWLPISAKIFSSWVKSDEPWIRYEDLLANDSTILEEVLLDQCGLCVDTEAFRSAVSSCRFANMTGGRERGEESIHSHQRKGIAGDWQNYFTPKLKRIFKRRFGDLLIRSGYEKDVLW
jgi:hypothetical protein